MSVVRILLVGLVALGLFALVGTYTGGAQLAGGVDGPTVFSPSDAWGTTVGEEAAAERERALTAAIVELREDTGSGWVGRQDDATGYLAELDGGYFVGDATDPDTLASEFLDTWGPALFGVDGGAMSFRSPEVAGRDLVVLRGQQQVGDVPVVDGELTIMVSEQVETRLTAVRGRVFAGLEGVATEPDVPAERARRVALDAAGLRSPDSSVQGEPSLLVFPVSDGGALAWQVTVMSLVEGQAPSVDAYFVDAGSGEIVAVRAQSIPHVRGPSTPTWSAAAARATATAQTTPGQGETVTVTGNGATGESLRATAVRQADGTVALLDPTLPWYDPASGKGLVATYDGSGIDPETEQGFPGQVVTAPSTQIDDPEAMSAHAQHRYILDYYGQVFGRTSWDGAGGGLTGIVRFPVECNAFFSGFANPPVMAYGSGCVPGQTFLDMDIAAHEVTHGVTHTTARLLYHGQSGALNESFSDYFGNVMGDDYYGRASTSLGEAGCAQLSEPDPEVVCVAQPVSGELAGRHFDAALGLQDYLRLLTPPYQALVQGVWSDNGGVHLNSGIWNSALWTVRSRLAAVDGGDMLSSPRARIFDQIVYRALTQQLTATSGFVDAATAVEEAARAAGAEAVIVDTIREVMNEKSLCAGCVTDVSPTGTPIATSTATEQAPVVTDSWSAWLDYQEDEAVGRLIVQPGSGTPVVASQTALAFAPVGDNILLMEDDLATQTTRLVLLSPDGNRRALQEGLAWNAVFTDVAGSDDLAAWLSDAAYAVDATGRVHQSAPIPAALKQAIFSVGAGGGTVVVGTTDGAVYAWRPGEGTDFQLVGAVAGGQVAAVDVHGSRIAALAAPPRVPFGGTLSVLDLAGAQPTVVSENAIPWTLSVTPEHLVWAEASEALAGGVADIDARESGSRLPDSDLYLHNFTSGTTYRLTNQPGQQGIPSLIGRHLAWVDAAAGGNDVYYAPLPDGL